MAVKLSLIDYTDNPGTIGGLLAASAAGAVADGAHAALAMCKDSPSLLTHRRSGVEGLAGDRRRPGETRHRGSARLAFPSDRDAARRGALSSTLSRWSWTVSRKDHLGPHGGVRSVRPRAVGADRKPHPARPRAYGETRG